MQEWERVNETLAKAATALGEFMGAAVEWATVVAKRLCDVLGSYSMTVVAYATVGKEHPEWVHRAKYSKKRRIRKKYNDKIIREYRKYSGNV